MMKVNLSCLNQGKPIVAMLVVDFALSGVNILSKCALNDGMSHFLMIIYRQGIATIFLIPIAYFRERKCWQSLNRNIVCSLFLSALFGATLCQYLFLLGLRYTSSTYSSAFINLVPVFTFLLALVLRMEKVNITSKSGRAKVLGTLICIGGALVLTLYQGMPVINAQKSHVADADHKSTYNTKNWVVGTMFLFGGSLVWSSWFVIQAKIGIKYPFQYSSTAGMSFFSVIQTAILCLIIDKNISVWTPRGKLQITIVTYTGIVGSGLCYVVMSWCVKQRGPVFTSAFGPFIQMFVAIFDVSLLHEQIYLGSILGSVLVVIGMYVLLWGKSTDIEFPKDVPAEGKENPCCNQDLSINISVDAKSETTNHSFDAKSKMTS